jgi:asparagine synthase (glutamine-hydrolysing)
MNFGFLVHLEHEALTFCRVGDEPADALPLLSTTRDRQVQAVFLGRLYHLADLRARLGSHGPGPAASPAEHLLAAYRQAGVKGLEWLEGDYAFALWDGQARRLLAARDPFGGFPLFWARVEGGLALSTALRPLLDRLPHRTVNRDYLASYLMLSTCGAQELNEERCAYEGIHRVLAGTRLEAGPGGVVQTRRWWDWAERVEAPATLEREELAGRYGELLREEVRQRVHGRVVAHFSGGMDSTAIAVLAARARAGREPVHALSLVYEQLPVLARETPYLDSGLGEPGLEPHRLRGDDFLDFDAYRDDTCPDEPVPHVWQSTMSRALTDRAAELGAQTVLTGGGADELVTEQPFHLHELLRRGQLRAAWRESARWAMAYSSSRWRFLGSYGLAPFVPCALRPGLGTWWRRGRVSWDRQSECTIAPWIRPEFSRRFGMWQRGIDRLRRTYHRCRPLPLSVAIETMEMNVGDVVRWELGVPHGLMIAHPFRSPRLVCFALGLQGRFEADPTRQKPLLADALRDVLPPMIRDRVGKGHFNEVFYRGLSRNLPMLESLVERAPVDDLELLDRPALLDGLRQAALGIGESTLGVDRLNLTLAVLKWLTVQEQALRRPGPPLLPFCSNVAPLPAYQMAERHG